MFAGVGKSRIDSRNFLDGRTLVGVISKPANSTLSCANTNLLGFNVLCVVYVVCVCTLYTKLDRLIVCKFHMFILKAQG